MIEPYELADSGQDSEGMIDPLIEAEIVDLPDPTPGRIGEGMGPRPELINFRILRSLRQIIQAVDLHSRHLTQVYSITGPQLVCLLAISDNSPVTLSELAQAIYLRPSTVVGIVDRLEREGFVQRQRSRTDRRVVLITITEKGKEFLAKAPSPIQDQLGERLGHLPVDEQLQIARALEKVAELMGAERIEAIPLLESGEITIALRS
jgi:DNA-binding MarR family transcriptional regulator